MAAPTIGRRPRTTPPPTARVNWSHPLAQSLVTCVSTVDHVTGSPLSNRGTPGSGGGIASTSTGKPMGRTRLNPAADFTVSAWHYIPATATWANGGYGAIFSDRIVDGDGQANASIFVSNAGTPSYGDSAATSFVPGSAVTGAFAPGKWRLATLTRNKTASSGTIYADTLVAGAFTSALTGRTDATTFALGATPATFSFSILGAEYGLYAVWNRCLSPGEVASLSADPFQMLEW